MIDEKLIRKYLERNGRSIIEVITGNFSGTAKENYKKPQ
jgi:hypothetical protein